MAGQGDDVQELLAEVKRLGAASAVFHRVVAEELGLRGREYECLDLLDALGPTGPGQLARELGVSTGAATGIVDRLEAGGWVRRRADPDDGRRVTVELAPERHAEVVPHFRGLSAGLDRLVAERSPAERRTVVRALAELADLYADEAARGRLPQRARRR